MSPSRAIAIPRDFDAQAKLCASCPDLDAVTGAFLGAVENVLGSNLISVMSSFSRTKTPESIERKREYRRKFQPERLEEPIVDIHGITVVIEEYPDIRAATRVIFDNWPTPELLFGRLPRLSDYSEPDQRPRAESDPAYQAIHLRVAIAEGARIAEVKLFSPQDELIDKLTRTEYEEKIRRALEG